jgi:predicted small metal-binding protein
LGRCATTESGIEIATGNEGADVKVMTCRELGGACDQQLSASTWEEMVKTMTRHVMDKHPDTAKAMEKMHNDDPTRWGREMKPKWDAKPDA